MSAVGGRQGASNKHTNVDKLHRGDFGFKRAERGTEFLATREFPKPTEHGRHGVLERGAGGLILGREPFFQFGCGGDTLGGWEAGTAEYELRGVLERAAAGVVEGDFVDQAAVDR